MVILDANFRANMLTNGSHQYIQPDPFPSISSGMDSKSSPLAMLQKTCSQIGADTSPVKPAISAEKKEDKKKEPQPQVERAPFKPYEMIEKKEDRPKSSDGKDRYSPSYRSSSERKTPKSAEAAVSSCSSSGTSPITRSGAEVLAGVGAPTSGSMKDLSSLGLHRPGVLSPLPMPHGYLAAAAASAELAASGGALRPTLPGLYPVSAASSPYLGLHHHAAAAGHHRPGDKCQNPYCPCTHGLGSPCPTGCLHCEHAKSLSAAGFPAASPYLGLGAHFYPPTSLPGLQLASSAAAAAAVAAAGSAAAASQQHPPIVCSWMSEGRYCGKRFSSTEELMQHLRTHTNLSASDSAMYMLHPAYQASLLGHRSPFAAASPLSPLSAARFHPYHHPKMPTSVASALPQLSPAAAHQASLAAYYSPYASLYARPPLP